MRHRIRLLAAALLLAATCPPAHAADWKSWNAGLQAGQASGKPILADFYTDWCGWCKRMDHDVYARQDVNAYLSSHFVTVRVNAEGGELTSYQGRNYSARALAAKFAVTGYPTTIFFASNGDKLVNVPGYVEADRFLLLLRFIGDGHMARNEKWDDYVKQSQVGH